MAAVIGISFVMQKTGLTAETVTMQLRNLQNTLGALALPAFAGVYVVATVVMLPASLFTIAAGAVFGPLWGTLASLAGATIGSWAAFAIARLFAADLLRARLGSRLDQLQAGIEREGWMFVAFTRLVPLFPFNVLNYALGLTRVRTSTYVVTSALTMIPGAALYAAVGHFGAEALQKRFDFKIVIWLLALGAAAVFLPRFFIRFRKNRTAEKKNDGP